MTPELVKCPHCGCRYRTDLEKIVDDGEIDAVRLGFSDIKKIVLRNTVKNLFIDLNCPNCKKEFKWEVKT